jgi:hypothetical protein
VIILADSIFLPDLLRIQILIVTHSKTVYVQNSGEILFFQKWQELSFLIDPDHTLVILHLLDCTRYPDGESRSPGFKKLVTLFSPIPYHLGSGVALDAIREILHLSET